MKCRFVHISVLIIGINKCRIIMSIMMYYNINWKITDDMSRQLGRKVHHFYDLGMLELNLKDHNKTSLYFHRCINVMSDFYL